MAFNFTIVYKQGKDNWFADALSIKQEAGAPNFVVCTPISLVVSDWIETIKEE